MTKQEAPKRLTIRRGEAVRIGLMLVVLLVLLLAFLFPTSSVAPKPMDLPVLQRAPLEVPVVDTELLAKVRDGTRIERLQTEEKVLAHLLEKSLNVVPAVAMALGMPAEPVSLTALRTEPANWRGKYLWFEGQLETLGSDGRGTHPVRGYRIHEAVLRTRSGDAVVAIFSLPPTSDLQVGSWVRAEGFFLKLRDGHFPPLEEAPVLVGPQLLAAMPDWPAVTELDPKQLERIRDGRLGPDGLLQDYEDTRLTLAESQGETLWHIASHVRHREQTLTPEQVAALPAFATRQQFEDFQLGRIAKGTPLRLSGTFVFARTFPARLNPVGIEHWSEVWLQSRDFGGRTILLWVPEDVAGDRQWQQNTPVLTHGVYFKRFVFENTRSQLTLAPVFVAAKLHRFEPTARAFGTVGAAIVGGLFLLTCAFLFWNQRRETRSRLQHERELIERRRKRRAVAEPAGSST